MNPRTLQLICLAVGASFASGCVTAPSGGSAPPQPAQAVAGAAPEGGEAFAALDSAAKAAIECLSLQHRLLADGRLDIVATLKNVGPVRFKFRVLCSFQTAGSGDLPTGDPGQTAELEPDAAQSFHFTAPRPGDGGFWVRVKRL